MASMDEKKNDSLQDNISKENISDQSIAEAINSNHKNKSRIKKFLKSENVRGWTMILVTGMLAILIEK
jgi:hypothetical protein